MSLTECTRRILALSATLHQWLAALLALDAGDREKIARYADEIAATLARAVAAFVVLERDQGDRAARLAAVRELGRIAGYVETIVDTLDRRVDGRKLAGVKRRLERLTAGLDPPMRPPRGDPVRTDDLSAAEGYFRALADGLRT